MADTGNSRVEEWTLAGALVRTIGSAGARRVDLSGPDGLAVSGGTLLVSDDANHRIEAFSASTGSYSSTITRDIGSPAGPTVDSSGDVWAA